MVKTKKKLGSFWLLFAVAQIVGIAAILLIFFRNSVYVDGFEIVYPTIFNWHPLLMSIGPIYCMGNALVAFRILRYVSKSKSKIIHAILNGIALLTAVLAITAAYIYHLNADIPNFYSIHSWVGLLTVFSLFIQGLVGLVTYLFPGLKMTIRQTLLPYHVYFGHAIFILAIISAIAGLNERAIFSMGPDYRNLPPMALMLNFTGVLFIIYGSLIIFITTNPSYRREPASNHLQETKGNS